VRYPCNYIKKADGMAFRREKKKAGWKPALLLAPGSNARLKAIHAHMRSHGL